MNFISEMEGQQIQVELKYCERCGGLWLRPQGTDGVYCASCRVCLAALPNPGGAPLRKADRRTVHVHARGKDVQPNPQNDALQSSARTEHLRGMTAMEVWA
jgi:Zn-finger nucleic acid-binding protein